MAAGPRPSLSMAPGRKFSISASAMEASFFTRASPAGRLRSTHKERLLRLKVGKKPKAGPVRRRVLSPAGAGSILITSAPRSARIMPQLGPMTMWLNSSTRMPASGRGPVGEEGLWLDISGGPFGLAQIGLGQACPGELAVEDLPRQELGQTALGLDQGLEVDAGVEAHLLQHEDEVLGGDVAARSWGMRAAAEATQRGIERADVDIESGHHVGEAKAARVVKVSRVEAVAGDGPHPTEQ